MFFSKWFNKNKVDGCENMAESDQTLSDIVRGMQYCVNSSAEMIERQYMDRIDRYFDENGAPLTYTVRLPDGSSMDVPLFALMNHSSLILDEMKVKMAVSIRKLDSKKSNVMYKDENSLEDVVSRTAFKVTLCDQGIPCESNGRSVDIEMTFKSGDAPESVARLVDQLLNGSCPYSPSQSD
mgnify:FL=1